MTNSLHDDRIDEYLWDPAAAPADEVRAIERQLAPLRFDPAARPLTVPPRVVQLRPRRRWVIGLAAAASIVLVAGWTLAQWRWSWPAGRAWPVISASAAGPAELAVGSALDLAVGAEARVRVARIGTMLVEGGSRVTLQSTEGIRHRLNLERGTVLLVVWAPPGSVVIRTPAGDVIDLGCQFDLTVEDGRSLVRVQSGWVQLDNGLGESLVPEGAASEMLSDRAPGVPVYVDAPARFLAAVRALEGGRGAGSDPVSVANALDEIVALARPRDVLTMLMLIQRRAPGADRLAARAAVLSPPPAGVSAEGVGRGDQADLDRWRESLPLPPPKSWLRNWRDALPAWLGGGLR